MKKAENNLLFYLILIQTLVKNSIKTIACLFWRTHRLKCALAELSL